MEPRFVGDDDARGFLGDFVGLDDSTANETCLDCFRALGFGVVCTASPEPLATGSSSSSPQ